MRNYAPRKPLEAGYYWARQNTKKGQVVLVLLSTDLLTVYWGDLAYDVYDFDWWSDLLKNRDERMPEFQ